VPGTDPSGLLGRTATREFVVSDADTAAAVGSGSLPVLGTPVLLAWCEAATCAALDLPEGSTSVGTRVSLEHLAPSPVGATVTVTAAVAYVDPSAGSGQRARLLRFTVEARMGETLVGAGEVTRVVVDAERFMARL
jgi:predicted thioesterase